MIPIKRLHELAKEQNYGFNSYQSVLGDAARVILVGEPHAAYNAYTFQSNLIELVKPDIVMHEFYDPNGKRSTSERINSSVERIMEWKKKYGVTLKPCDLPQKKIKQFTKTVERFLQELDELSDESDLDSIIIDDNAIRELVMGKLIRTEAGRIPGVIMVIVGGYHVRPESLIHQELQCCRPIEIGARMPLSYVTINQDDLLTQIMKKGERFFK